MPYILKFIFSIVLFLSVSSCLKIKDLYEQTNPSPEEYPLTKVAYNYPYKNESGNITAELTITSHNPIDIRNITTEIPVLKYNKTWLLMFTQDDCEQAAYCRSWAAINGKPVSDSNPYINGNLSSELFFDAAHLYAGDLPPNVIAPGKTLGSTDGAGNEIRFAITTTLLPESSCMSVAATVKPGWHANYHRFFMKSGLIWDNVIEMTNFGTGIAFHDVDATDVNDPSDIYAHLHTAQECILKQLNGRGCKMLAEPNGNKNYISAAMQFADIQTMVAQSSTERLFPFKVSTDLNKQILYREFNEDPEYFKEKIKNQLVKPVTEREAIHIGVHRTDNKWIHFLEWINEEYGKDGDDSVWFPGQEEYYEYNYHRIYCRIKIEQVTPRIIKIKLNSPGDRYFYYPSLTLNLNGIKRENIADIAAGETVSGLSCSNYKDGVSLNIDCRKGLKELASHYVNLYETDKPDKLRKADALYFVNLLKASDYKSALLKRID
ncbi:MAG: hypothetical protein RR346_05070 [Bacteroidales bacterium]